MKNFPLTKFKPQTKIFWGLLLLAGFLISGWAVFSVAGFTVTQLIVLAVALVISCLINQHEFTIPSTKITLTAGCLTIFAGTFLLGTAGGVLCAVSVAGVRYKSAADDKTRWLLDGLIKIAAAFAAGIIFYLALKFLNASGESLPAENPVAVAWFILAAVLTSVGFSLFSVVLHSAYAKLENNPPESFGAAKNKNRQALQNCAFGIAGALILHFALLEFGLPFGFVILLMAAALNYAYYIYDSSLAQKTREIGEASRVHLATVEVLATAIDARDQVGIGHVRRTQIYAVGMGKILGLSANELQALNTGALLHDIGKLAVPDHILNKPGRLTPAEMEKIKIHALVGASILEKVDFAYPVVPTVKYHHEMWDGSGYPEGLKGEEIPLTARILSVADAFDSLRGARPYRAPVSRDEARRFLINGSGKHFDQQIVDLFLRNLQKLEAEIEAQGLSYSFDQKNHANAPTAFDENSDKSYVEHIKRANREVYTLYELARVFSSSLNLEETLSLFVQKISELVPFDTCVVYLLEESREYAKAVYVQGENKSFLKEKRVKTGEGATGFVLKKCLARCDKKSGLDFAYDQPQLSRDYSSMASLPLTSDEKLLGAVSLYSYNLQGYEEEHLRLLETVSRIASDALVLALQHAESENRALTDPMTDLPNARSLQMQFEKETARAGRNGSSFQVLMLDLDGFKAVNDTFGHNIGDKLLKELAVVMRNQLRDYDFLARYAGDEFVVIAPETDGIEIHEICQRMEKAVSDFKLPVGEDNYARVGISIGAACYPNHGDTLDQVIVSADKAMYAVKAERKAQRAKESKVLVGEILEPESFTEENYIVELDESHIVSSAIN